MPTKQGWSLRQNSLLPTDSSWVASSVTLAPFQDVGRRRPKQHVNITIPKFGLAGPSERGSDGHPIFMPTWSFEPVKLLHVLSAQFLDPVSLPLRGKYQDMKLV